MSKACHDTARHQLVADDLRSLIETASTAIFGVDARGRALGLNWSFEKFITCWNGPAHNIQPTKQRKHSRTRQYNSIYTHTPTHTHITPHHTMTLYHPISEFKHTETRRRPNNLLQLQTPQGTMCVQDNVRLCVWWWYVRGNVLVCLDGA